VGHRTGVRAVRGVLPGEPMSDDLREVYDELRRTARRLLRNEPYDHTMASCDLVNRAFERLLNGDLRDTTLADPRSVIALAVTNMRRELVDHARRRRSQKRPDARVRVDLDDAPLFAESSPHTFLEVDRLLDRLASGDDDRIRFADRRAMVARYALYGGLTESEISQLVDVPKSTVGRDVRFVRAWLMARLQEGVNA
jgi:RNA polymerase sigma factor (TIGR02999 family)